MNILNVEKRIVDLEMDSTEESVVHNGRIDILYWVKIYQPTDEEIQNKIQRIKEELLPLNDTDIWYREKQSRIEELESLLYE